MSKPSALERRLNEQLVALWESYRLEAAPIIARLVALQALKPPAPIWLDARTLSAHDLTTVLEVNVPRVRGHDDGEKHD